MVSHFLSQANIGQMDTPKELWKMITGNMALIQVRRGRGIFTAGASPALTGVGGSNSWVLLFAVSILCLMRRKWHLCGPAGWTGCFHAGF